MARSVGVVQVPFAHVGITAVLVIGVFGEVVWFWCLVLMFGARALTAVNWHKSGRGVLHNRIDPAFRMRLLLLWWRVVQRDNSMLIHIATRASSTIRNRVRIEHTDFAEGKVTLHSRATCMRSLGWSKAKH
jgi:hypothetical protein